MAGGRKMRGGGAAGSGAARSSFGTRARICAGATGVIAQPSQAAWRTYTARASAPEKRRRPEVSKNQEVAAAEATLTTPDRRLRAIAPSTSTGGTISDPA